VVNGLIIYTNEWQALWITRGCVEAEVHTYIHSYIVIIIYIHERTRTQAHAKTRVGGMLVSEREGERRKVGRQLRALGLTVPTRGR
jgi:amino acid permease